jgi:hypothetical protein
MRLTKQKLTNLIKETLEQEEMNNLLSMFQSGDPSYINQAIELLDMMGEKPTPEMAEALLRTPNNEKLNRLGLDLFIEATMMPQPLRFSQMGDWIQLDYPLEDGEGIVDLLKGRQWKEGRGFQTDDFWYMPYDRKMIILIPIRQAPSDDSGSGF